MRSRIKQRLLLLIPVLLLLAPSWAFAGTSGTGEVLSAFTSATSGWYNSLLSVAEGIFYVLFGVDFVYLVAQWLIGGKDVHEIFTSFIKKIMTIGVFYTILLNAHKLVGWVMSGFQQAGTDAAGTPHTGISWILSTGVSFFVACVEGPVKAATSGGVAGFLWNTLTTGGGLEVSAVIGAFAGLITGIMAILALIYLALEYIAIQLEALLVGSIGVIMLGFSGSRWTAQHGEGYLKYALSVGVRFLVLTVWVAFIESTAPTIVKTLLAGVKHAGADNIPYVLSAYANVLIFVILIAWMAKKLPSIAGSIMTGSSSMSGGELLSSAAKTAALVAAGVATAGAGAAVAGAGAGTGALSAAEAASGEAGALGAAGEAGAAGGEAGSMSGGNGASDTAGSNVDAVPAPQSAPMPGQGQTAKDAAQENNVPAPGAAQPRASTPPGTQSGDAPKSSETANPADAEKGPEHAREQSGDGLVQGAEEAMAGAGMTRVVDAAETSGRAGDVGTGSAGTAGQTDAGTSDVDGSSATGTSGAAGTSGVSGTEGATGAAGTSGAGAKAVDSAAPAPKGAAEPPVGPQQGQKPDTDSGTDHRPDAPNTPTQTVSGGSNDVPAPVQNTSNQTDSGNSNEPSAPAPQPEQESLLERADRYGKMIDHGLNVVSPGNADTKDVQAAGIGLRHSE